MVHSKELESYKKSLKLTESQKKVLYGILLGDAHLETQNDGKTYRLKIEQSISHKAYVDHLYEVFREWVRTEPKVKTVKSGDSVSENYYFQTLSHGAFRFFAKQFYADGEKRVPKLIHRWLGAEAFSYWYMDDGSIKSSESKGVLLNTQGFAKTEVEQLCEILEKNLSLEAKPRKQKEGLQIYISGNSYERFCEITEPFIIPEMQYKVPNARITPMPKE